MKLLAILAIILMVGSLGAVIELTDKRIQEICNDKDTVMWIDFYGSWKSKGTCYIKPNVVCDSIGCFDHNVDKVRKFKKNGLSYEYNPVSQECYTTKELRIVESYVGDKLSIHLETLYNQWGSISSHSFHNEINISKKEPLNWSMRFQSFKMMYTCETGEYVKNETISSKGKVGGGSRIMYEIETRKEVNNSPNHLITGPMYGG